MKSKELWTVKFHNDRIVIDNKWCMERATKDFFLNEVIEAPHITDKEGTWQSLSDTIQSELIQDFFEGFRWEFEEYV